MPVFQYKAYDQSGAIVLGDIEAIDSTIANKQLLNENLKPVSITSKSESSSFSISLGSKKKITPDDIEFITAELSLLLDSGVKIDRCLAVLAKAKSGSALSELLDKLTTDVRKGLPLSVAMAAHGQYFDKLYVNLVQIGESSGNLPTVFAGLSTDLKYRKELKGKILQAITYPTVIFSVCVLSVFFIFNFIVPKLSVMFNDAEELPYYTQILLGVSDWIQNYQYYLVLFIFSLFFGLRWAYRQGDFSHRFDEYFLQMPILKTVVTLIERIRFSSSMSLMLGTGIKLDQALELSSGSVKNQIISQKLSIVRDKVRKGESITESLSQSRLFPELFMSLLEVGEESGKMGVVFEEIASRSRKQFSQWTDKMTSLIEPLMILFMGGIVGTVVVVMLMSIVSVNEIGF